MSDSWEDAGNSIEAWAGYAKVHHFAANALREARNSAVDCITTDEDDIFIDHLETIPIEILLRGFALECLFYAIWLKRGNKLVNDGKFKGPDGVGDHQLYQFAGVCGLNCNMDMLKRWTRMIVWWSRYPIPKKPTKGSNKDTYTHPGDDDDYMSLVTNLTRELGHPWDTSFCLLRS